MGEAQSPLSEGSLLARASWRQSLMGRCALIIDVFSVIANFFFLTGAAKDSDG